MYEEEAKKYPRLQEMYTRVLRANLDFQLLNFPAKATGASLDAIARRNLWEVGADFAHGLGHGVSHCGPVHEYPHYAFAKDPSLAWPLEPGMIITNEPGFYKEKQYGIRIENVLHVTKSPLKDFLCFENMTLVPYCKELI